MVEVFLLGGVCTPQGKYAGALSGARPDDLAGLVVGEAVSRAGVPGDAVDEVVLGAANQAGEDNRDIGRMAVLLGGLPTTVPGYTVNRLCASGLTAVISAAQAVRSGEADVVVAGGVESMTRAPWVIAKPGTPWAKPGEIADTSLGWRFTNPRFSEHDSGFESGRQTETDGPWTLSMGETAEEVAALDGIGRDECDEFALESHRRAVAAGNSSPLSDGAAALVVVSERAVRDHGLRPLARVIVGGGAGVSPHLMGLGPVSATQKVLSRAGWDVDDLDAVELNEAFAAQSLACIRRLGLDPEKVNANGGAIALGHPLGCSGARITVTLLNRLHREGGRRGLATLCVGVGQGVAMVVERV
jgi:hypothetical protein